jgi:hypothetical protein
MGLEYFVIDQNEKIIDRYSCNWLRNYDNKSNDIKNLIDFCDQYIEDYNNVIKALENMDIVGIKKRIIDYIQEAKTIEYVINNVRTMYKEMLEEYEELSQLDMEILVDTRNRFIEFRNFLEKYKFETGYFES